ncbi:MAG: phosphoribosyltransferase family protein, partial [Methylocystis sp.]|nr:phosphoribosyltransferase family protein [Methylocystis sp.]
MQSVDKNFPVSWDTFHRDARALAWRLASIGGFSAIVAVTRGGLVPAAIVARELGIRVIETIGVASYHEELEQGEVKVVKPLTETILKRPSAEVLIVDDLVDT